MGKMHAGELDIDRALVARLLAAQFPQWADLPVGPVPSAGTDNAIYRLGSEMAIRLPRVAWATEQITKENLWLPKLAAHLPLSIPVPLALGQPDQRYPWPWLVYRWVEGDDAQNVGIVEERSARDLADFISALHCIDLAAWPTPDPPVGSRGVPLSTRDHPTRAAITELSGIIDTGAATAAWNAALRAAEWSGPPLWTHGDLLPGNLLIHLGRLNGVIDFSCLGVGDPACDLIATWALFSAQTRDLFRSALSVDDATWARGRGWALSIGLIALPYYQKTNPVFAATARKMITEVLADWDS
jgi:aminoglycoside phosphotransferase (APT) family kinase protein